MWYYRPIKVSKMDIYLIYLIKQFSIFMIKKNHYLNIQQDKSKYKLTIIC